MSQSTLVLLIDGEERHRGQIDTGPLKIASPYVKNWVEGIMSNSRYENDLIDASNGDSEIEVRVEAEGRKDHVIPIRIGQVFTFEAVLS